MAPRIKVKERVTAEGEIDLSMSDLEEVPIKEILQFKKVHNLDLSNNRLAILPPTFPMLTHLIKLDLSKNELVALPDDFGELAKLRHLDLYSNRLERLPLSFGKLKELKWLDLKDNPLIPTLAKIAGPCLDMKQCQLCARNIVNFFVKLEEQVNTDLEERQKVRSRQMEINQQKKQEAKKAKKKEKQKQRHEVYISKKNSMMKQIRKNDFDIFVHTESPKNNTPVTSAIENRSIFKNFLKFATLTGTVLFISTSVKWRYTENIELTVKDLYSFLLDKVPQSFRPYGVNFGEVVHECHQRTGALTLQVIQYVNETIPESKREQLYDSFSSTLHYCIEKIKEVYNHFSNK